MDDGALHQDEFPATSEFPRFAEEADELSMARAESEGPMRGLQVGMSRRLLAV